jgi:hypothetical protein
MEAWERGGTGRGKGTAAGTITDADDVGVDVGPEGLCSDWCTSVVTDGGGRSGEGGVDGGGIRVVLSIEDQPPVRNAGAG